MVKNIAALVISAVIALFVNKDVSAASLPSHLGAEISLSSGVIVRVDIETISFSSTTPKIKAVRWGADSSPEFNPPRRIISSMQILLGGEKLTIPLSAFGDLCDPRTLTLKPTQRGFMLKITGSETGEAYEARIYFEGDNILRRKVASSINPESAWEETTYHSEFPENL